jgi:hypothetical protein
MNRYPDLQSALFENKADIKVETVFILFIILSTPLEHMIINQSINQSDCSDTLHPKLQFEKSHDGRKYLCEFNNVDHLVLSVTS